jgi:cellulose synthase/poly-beta-1,6-N-acetylglucosamine synthase-like glycosyltransferase
VSTQQRSSGPSFQAPGPSPHVPAVWPEADATSQSAGLEALKAVAVLEVPRHEGPPGRPPGRPAGPPPSVAARLPGGGAPKPLPAPAREKRRPLTHLQNCVLVLLVASIGAAAFLGALTSTSLSHFCVSVLLGGISWRFSFWLLCTWRNPDSPAGIRGIGIDSEPGSSARARPGPWRLARCMWVAARAVLLLAAVMSPLYLFWVRPQSWRYGLVIAVAVLIATPGSSWLGRPAAAVARHVLAPVCYRTGMRRLWDGIPAATRMTIGQLLLLNVLIMLGLLETAGLSPGFWAVHAKAAFAVMFCADALLLQTSRVSALRADPVNPAHHLPLPRTSGADATARPGRADRRHPGNGRAPAAPEAIKAASSSRLRRLPAPRFRGKAQKALAAVCVTLAVGWISYAHPGLILVAGVMMIGAALLFTMNVSRHHAITMLLAIGTGVASVDYMSWRFAVTNWQGWWIAAPLLFAEALGAIHTLGFQCTIWPRPRPVIEPREDPTTQAIFILVPTVNEGVSTLRPTLDGCIAARRKYLARYPHGRVTIVVCNDGRAAGYPRWAEIETLARELGVRCVTRSSGGGAKAGNIENARQECRVTQNSLLVIFDADQVPEPDFLLKTVPPFADPEVGWVQTGQYYANLNNPVSRWADDQQSMFYNLLCPGKATVNAAFICGTNVVIRGAALDEIGGLPQDSVTEDFAASIALHARWRSIYLPDVLATGLGPLDVPSYLKQQGRWALGTLNVFRTNWRDILLPRKNGLRAGQRVQYFLACTHYLCGLRDLIYLLSPVLFIFTGIPAVHTATLSEYLWHFTPYGMLGILGMWYSAQGVTGLRGIIIGFGSIPVLIGSLVAVTLHRKRPFAVTSKEIQGRRSVSYLGVYVFFLLLCLVALFWATQMKGRQETSLFISLLWIVYSLVLLSSFLWLACKDIRTQRAGAAKLTGKQAYRSKLLMRKNDLKPVLNLGLAALIAGPVLLGTRLASLPVFTSAAPPFVVTQQQVNARYTGVSLPVQFLKSEPPVLEQDLGARFSIIGRTQNITDQFDTAWAERLAGQGARPWIVLQFGVFGPDHEPSLSAGLPAIFNGADDDAIRRWAAEIRDFGKPVYLTVLLQADKNWSVSSGVANGGIPGDVPKAWLHVQSVFREAGADNVAWVWAPADPVHDQQFAPPPSSIDAVLQDFINYPGTRWKDPVKVLPSLVRRYPGKPLFIEASVSGPAAKKAAWLAALGRAVSACPQLYALLYHQGGPDLKPTPAQARDWSLASDPASLAVWRQIVLRLRSAGGSRGDLRRAEARPGGPPGGRPGLAALAAHTDPGPAGRAFRRHAA